MEQARRFNGLQGMAGSMHARTPRTRFAVRLIVAALLLGLTGCETMVAIATHELMTGTGIASYVLTGKGLVDHALTVVTNKDCRIVPGIVSGDRGICEDFVPENMPTLALGMGPAVSTFSAARSSPSGLDSLLLSDTLLVTRDVPSGEARANQGRPSAGVDLSLSSRINRDWRG